MIPATRRHGFTLLEALIATTLLMVIMGVLTTIWQNAYRAADRTRAILDAHQRARQAMDAAEDLLLQRSGAMPLMAQNNAPGRQAPFRLGAWQSKVHMDGTSMDSNSLYANEASLNLDLDGNGTKTGNFPELWSIAPPNGLGTSDAYSPGREVRNATIGNWGWQWGMGRKMLWHSDIVRFDYNRSFLDPAVASPAWGYANVDCSWNAKYLDQVGDGLTNQYFASIIGKRYSSNAVTGVNGSGFFGPFRDSCILPWVHKDAAGTERATPWLGLTHMYRAVSGPGFYRAADAKGLWRPQKSGSYGTASGSLTINGYPMTSNRPLEPDWGFVNAGNWTPSAADPAVGTPRPAYGSLVTDNGGVVWRCDAPFLMSWDSTLLQYGNRIAGMITSTGVNDNWGTKNTGQLFRSAQLRDILVVCQGNPDVQGGMGGYGATALGYSDQASRAMTANLDHFTIRNARYPSQWPAANAPANAAAAAARGRWGSLTLPGWWNGSSSAEDPAAPWHPTWIFNSWNQTDGMAAGFPGAVPSGEEQPNHPAWVAVDVGVVGGLDRIKTRPFQLAFSYALVLR